MVSPAMRAPLSQDNARSWEDIPKDCVASILSHNDRATIASLRRLCKAWRAHVDATIREVELGSWPEEPQFVRRFPVLSSCHLRSPSVVQDSHRLQMPGILAELAQLDHLRGLGICHTGPSSLANLSLLTGLTSLSISRGPYPDTRFLEPPHLPPQVSAMTRLQHLRLANTVPNHTILQSLRSLRRLELVGHTLKARTPMLSSGNPLVGLEALTQIETLIARCNYGVSRLPASIGALTGLRHLDLSKNMLCLLPASMGNLAALTHLDLSSNCLSSLPPEIGSLASLRFLDLSTNSRLELPESLRRLGATLTSLRLNWVWADLTVFFGAAAAFSALEELQLTGNGLTSLSPAVARLRALKSLTLTMNSIDALPREIGSLSRLQSLELSDNRLSCLSPSIGGMKALRVLGLRSNNITHLPTEVGCLTSLTGLDLSMNQISDLPGSMTSLQLLHELALNFNPLRCLPPQLQRLSSLRILELYYVRLQGYSRQVAELQTALPRLFIFTGCMCPRSHCSIHNPLRLNSIADGDVPGAEPTPRPDSPFCRTRPPTNLLGPVTPPPTLLHPTDSPSSSTPNPTPSSHPTTPSTHPVAPRAPRMNTPRALSPPLPGFLPQPPTSSPLPLPDRIDVAAVAESTPNHLTTPNPTPPNPTPPTPGHQVQRSGGASPPLDLLGPSSPRTPRYHS